MEKRIKILRAGIWWEFAHYRKAPKTAQNGWRRAGVVPNPEFTPRNTTTGVFEFWRLAGPKETRSGNFYSLFHSPAVPRYPVNCCFFGKKKGGRVQKMPSGEWRSARAPSVDARPGALRQRVHGLRQTGRKREAITSGVGPIGTSTWPIGRPPPSRGRGVQ